MPRLSITASMNSKSRMEQASFDSYRDVILDYDALQPSSDNFYPLTELEELADNMLTCGHIEPIVIARVDGKDLIVSGHRRYYAIGINIKNGHEEFKKVRCSVKAMSHAMYIFTLASANAFTRKIDDATLLKQAETLRVSLQELVDSGEITIHGKMRDYIADSLGISHTKMAQVNKVNSSLISEGKEALASGNINFSKAYEVSKLPVEQQAEAIHDKHLLSTDVKRMAYEMNSNKTKVTKVQPVRKEEEDSEKADISSLVEFAEKRIPVLKSYIEKIQKEENGVRSAEIHCRAELLGYQLIIDKYRKG